MDRNTVRDIIRGRLTEYVEQITEKSKGKNMYICPLCQSGTGKNRTGAFSIDPKDPAKWRCFACGAGGDIFDLIGIIENLSDYNSQFARLSTLFGVSVDREGGNQSAGVERKNTMPKRVELPQDFTSFLTGAQAHITDTDYWRKRGLSYEIVQRCGIGYVEKWTYPGKPESYPSARLIIPTDGGGYIARATSPEAKLRYLVVGNVGLFEAATYNEDGESVKTGRLYIVEGAIDAMSIAEVGGDAVALNSADNWRRIVNEFSESGAFSGILKNKQPVIIALDNDKAGEDHAAKLRDALIERGVKVICYSPAGFYKDSNEALMNNRDEFKTAVWFGIRASDDDLSWYEEQRAYKKMSSYYQIPTLLDEIEYNRTAPATSTGFKCLDNLLNGGLREGLYSIGAKSALGKTTFTLQIADQIAQNGRDVLIFALEMGRTELMAKSISRHTVQRIMKYGGNVHNAKTNIGILDGSQYEKYSDEEKQLINDAINDYKEYADHIYIQQGVGDIGAAQIRAAVDNHVRLIGSKPVVIVDYLQILAPYDVRATDKQNIDKAVIELKRLSRDFKIPVICISSFSRANYKTAADMASFKESGGIEYTSDAAFGLQYEGIGNEGFDEKKAAEENPRKLELVTLKMRNGEPGTIPLYFYGKFNLYIEREDEYKPVK